MSPELAVTLLELFQEDSTMYFQLPVRHSDVQSAQIKTASDGKRSLQLNFRDSAPKDVVTMISCVLVEPVLVGEPTNTTVLLRTWVHLTYYLRLLLGNDAPEFILYRCAPTTGVTEARMAPGTLVGTATSALEIFFFASESGGSIRAVDPAIVIRVFALFHDDFTALTDSYLELLLAAIAVDPSESFGLARFAAHHDAVAAPAYRKRLLNDVLRLEYDSRRKFGMAMNAATEAIYTARLPLSGGRNNSRANVVASYHVEVDADPDAFAHFYINDMNLHLAIFRADRYEMDLLDIRGQGTKFSDLLALTDQYKIIVNGPVFDSGVCYYQEPVTIPVVDVKVPVGRAWEYFKGAIAEAQPFWNYKALTKGTLLFRGQLAIVGDCPIKVETPSDRDTWRYHFAQTSTGAYELHLGPIPLIHDYEVAVEPLIGVFRNGLRIGSGHEIDTMSSDGIHPRREPDSLKSMRSLKAGIPVHGRCQRLGVEYLFTLFRPDHYLDKPVMSSWEEIVSLLRDIGVVDAFFTDGDDSVGLIIDGLGMVADLEPGVKKMELMPLAIGFRKVA